MRLSGVASSALTLFGLAQAIDHIPYPCHGTYQGMYNFSNNLL